MTKLFSGVGLSFELPWLHIIIVPAVFGGQQSWRQRPALGLADRWQVLRPGQPPEWWSHPHHYQPPPVPADQRKRRWRRRAGQDARAAGYSTESNLHTPKKRKKKQKKNSGSLIIYVHACAHCMNVCMYLLTGACGDCEGEQLKKKINCHSNDRYQ